MRAYAQGRGETCLALFGKNTKGDTSVAPTDAGDAGVAPTDAGDAGVAPTAAAVAFPTNVPRITSAFPRLTSGGCRDDDHGRAADRSVEREVPPRRQCPGQGSGRGAERDVDRGPPRLRQPRTRRRSANGRPRRGN